GIAGVEKLAPPSDSIATGGGLRRHPRLEEPLEEHPRIDLPHPFQGLRKACRTAPRWAIMPSRLRKACRHFAGLAGPLVRSAFTLRFLPIQFHLLLKLYRLAFARTLKIDFMQINTKCLTIAKYIIK
ncbi:MAG: hypothetical protein LBO03_00430, partial [Acidaminococcales bacterium]|nr:hypothetical protein [Acidaminococcales bacterium]